MKDTKYIREWTKAIVARDEAERNPMWRDIERTYHLEYNRPAGTKQIAGYHAVIKPGPYKDILVTKNVFQKATPRIKIKPFEEKFEGKRVANEREQALKWWLQKADRRGGNSVQGDILESAALYGTVCAQVRHIDYARRAQKEQTGKEQAFRRQHGPFGVKVYNPMDVHWQMSDDGLERVVSVSVRPIHEVIDTWGDKAKKLEKAYNAKKNDASGQFKYATEFYYCDLEQIYVWAVPSVTNTVSATNIDSKDAVDILVEENKLGFINWVIEDLSSSLEKHGKYKVKPLLWYVVQSGSWETDCTLASLQMTQGIQAVGKPAWKIEGPNVSDIDVTPDYDQISGGVLRLPSGYTASETQPGKFDQGLQILQQNLAQYQSETGVSAALMGQTSAETFAGQNQQIAQGQASVASVQIVSEATIVEICYQFLQWLKVVDQPLKARGVDKPYVAQEYTINPNEIDIETLYIECELSSENEGTRIQQANTAAIAKQLGLSDETALEWLGLDDPLGELKKRKLEELTEFKFQEYLKMQSAQSDMLIQQQMTQQQMAMQQEQMAQMQAAQPPQMDMGGDASYFGQQPLTPPTPDTTIQLPGQGGNAAAGGIPNALLNPGATLEGQTGMTRGGAPIQ